MSASWVRTYSRGSAFETTEGVLGVALAEDGRDGIDAIPVVRMGLDPTSVRHWAQALEGQAAEARARAEALADEVAALRAQVERLAAERNEALAQARAVGETLIVAQQAAAEVREEARTEAERVVAEAQQKATARLRDAAVEAEGVVRGVSDRVRVLEGEEAQARERLERALANLDEVRGCRRSALAPLREPEREIAVES